MTIKEAVEILKKNTACYDVDKSYCREVGSCFNCPNYCTTEGLCTAKRTIIDHFERVDSEGETFDINFIHYHNEVNLCDSCKQTYPECPSTTEDVLFGDGKGDDNICACALYKPKTGDRTTDDIISRQAEIDALKEEVYPCETDYDEGYMAALKKAIWVVEKWLPPVQPEQRWIPCNERLPDYSVEVLTYTAIADFIEVQTLEIDNIGIFHWENQEGDWQVADAVTAWMPLPEPYKEERREDEN